MSILWMTAMIFVEFAGPLVLYWGIKSAIQYENRTNAQ